MGFIEEVEERAKTARFYIERAGVGSCAFMERSRELAGAATSDILRAAANERKRLASDEVREAPPQPEPTVKKGGTLSAALSEASGHLRVAWGASSDKERRAAMQLAAESLRTASGAREVIGGVRMADGTFEVAPGRTTWDTYSSDATLDERMAGYRRCVVEHGPGSTEATAYEDAFADDSRFVAVVANLKTRRVALSQRKAQSASVLRRAAVKELGWKVAGAAWFAVKAASVASAAGYLGRLAWVDLAAKYFG